MNEQGIMVTENMVAIPEKRVMKFFEEFEGIKYYERAVMLMNTVISNGERLKNFFDDCKKETVPFDLSKLDELLNFANKLTFDYCSSIGIFEDLLRKSLSKDTIALGKFDIGRHNIYSTQKEYRFWVKFRNFVVHYNIPIENLIYKKGEGLSFISSKDYLLRFDGWGCVKRDINEMNSDPIDVELMIEPMKYDVYWLYIHYLFCAGQYINRAAEAIHSLLHEYPLNHPVFLCYNEEPNIAKKIVPTIKTIKIDTVNKALEDLKKHPNAR